MPQLRDVDVNTNPEIDEHARMKSLIVKWSKCLKRSETKRGDRKVQLGEGVGMVLRMKLSFCICTSSHPSSDRRPFDTYPRV